MRIPEVRILQATTPDALDTEINAYIERKAQEKFDITYSGQVQMHEGVFYIQIESFREVADVE